MKTASVSVIIPCFNCADTIERAVESVFRQTCLPLEIILVNDGSSDGTLEKLTEIKKAHRALVKLIKLEQNMGPSAARNVAWESASGDCLAFIDADDSWHPRKIEIQYSLMVRHKEVAITGHLIEQLNSEITDFTLPKDWKVQPVGLIHLLLSNRLLMSTIMIKREVPYRFCEEKRHSEDYLLWLETVFNGFRAWRINLTMTYSYRSSGSSKGLSSNLWNMEKGELDTYRRLCQKGLLPVWGLLPLVPLSLFKYLIRVIKKGVTT